MSPFVYVPLNILLPGMGDVALGPPFRKNGWYTFGLFFMGFPLLFAFGLGVFVIALVWLGNVGTTIKRVVRGDLRAGSSPKKA